MRRFTLRDLFWLTLVVAMGVGWWLDRGRLAERAMEADHYEALADIDEDDP